MGGGGALVDCWVVRKECVGVATIITTRRIILYVADVVNARVIPGEGVNCDIRFMYY